MSKVDAQRALREARYAASASAATPAVRPAAPASKATTPTTRPAAKQSAKAPDQAPVTGLCGHRSMNGRSCTRDAGHSEKNHRYG